MSDRAGTKLLRGLEDCSHERMELRAHSVIVNGATTRHVRNQCVSCGGYAPMKKAEVLAMGVRAESLPKFDDELSERLWKQRGDDAIRRYEQEKEAAYAKWWAEYDAYLRTDAWARRRDLVLERDLGECQARMDLCSRVATQVHHTTYAHVRAEPLWELQSVCGSCHEAITEADRARREAARNDRNGGADE